MAFTQGVAQTIHVGTVVSTDHLTPTAPTTPVVTVSLDGGATFEATDNAAAATLYGISLVLSAAETARAAVLVRVTSANCDPVVSAFYFEDNWTVERAAALPDVAHGAAGGLPVLDSNLQLPADLGYIHGAALTEGAHGRLAASVTKFGDVATPLLVASDAMRGTDGAITSLSGIATTTNVTDAVAAVESYGQTNWKTAAGFAAPGAAMTLTEGERTSVGTAVWAATTRTLTSIAALTSALVTAIWAAATRTVTSWAPLIVALRTQGLSAVIGSNRNARITWPRGRTTEIEIAVTDGTSAYDLTDATLQFGIFQDPSAATFAEAVVGWTSDPGGGITMTDAVGGTAVLSWAGVSAGDIELLGVRTRYWFLWVVAADGTVDVPASGEWVTTAAPIL
jgi:hypothetical protein